VGQRDHLGVFVASSAIIGVLGLSLVIGPELGGTVEQAVETPQVAPAPSPVAPAPEPEPAEESPVRAVPLQVRIGAISVDAPIVPVGLEEDGAMEIPDRVAEIGWYDPDGLGVSPGSTGTAVLAGHVDSRSQGRGALYDLRDLRVGEIIEVDLDDGTVQRWLINEVIQYPKDVLPLYDVFTWSGPPRLVVITCGGTFDRTVRSYTDNLVVYAEPLDDTPSA
jgi:sortase (surface protein transpeptidase)